ncbi:MAG: sensor signal transduction histidine kinase [Bryobacterales bacterium]|jgi:signal transduction histidine kinase|nr:sensor signal transduction histidine kinase [Bryobacterales bacterium]
MESGEAQNAVTDDSQVLEHIRRHWLSNLIHDFSNPLFAARGYLRLVLEERDGPLLESQRRYLTSALENVEKLTRLTQGLDEFREMSGLKFAVVSFRSLLDETVASIQPALSAKNVAVTEHSTGGSLSTIGDPKKLAEALHGFLIAAVEFTGVGGSLQIQAREENEKITLEFAASPDGGGAASDSALLLSAACRMWRLHGGTCSLGPTSDGSYLAVYELPVVRLLEC